MVEKTRCYVAMVVCILSLLLMTSCSHSLVLGSSNYEAAALDQDWITLRIAVFDRNNTPYGAPPLTNNFMTQYIQENFGDPNQINVEFVTIPRAEEVSRLDVLMAANQAPDIIFTYDLPTVYKYITQGKITDLMPYIVEFGQELEQLLGEEVLNEGRFGGKQYAIPAKRILRAHSTTIIREDWLQELGLALPDTTEEFYAALVAIKEKMPQILGYEVIPYSHFDFFHTANIRYSFLDWDQISEEDLYAKPSWILPGNREAFRFMNQMYHEGLIEPNFALDRFARQFQKDIVNSRVAAGTPNTNEPVYMGYLNELLDKDPDAILTPIDPFINPNGKRMKPILEITGMYIMVPSNSKYAAEAVKYLNWMAQPENYTTLQNGIEGLTYEMIDGLPVTLQNEEAKRILYNYFDYCIILNGKFVSLTDMELNIKANAVIDSRFEQFTLDSVKYAMTDTIEIPRIKAILESEIKYANVLSEKEEEIFVKVITANPNEFDLIYDQEVEEYMRIGGQQVMEERQTVYRQYRN